MESVLESVLELVIGVVVLLIGALVTYFRPKLKKAFEDKERDSKAMQDLRKLGVIDGVADMGVELIEKEFDGDAGEKKFNEAASYVANMANRYEIDVSDEFIKGAVQKAWRKMDNVQKSNKKEENKE